MRVLGLGEAQVLVKTAKGLRDTAVLEQHLQQTLQVGESHLFRLSAQSLAGGQSVARRVTAERVLRRALSLACGASCRLAWREMNRKSLRAGS